MSWSLRILGGLALIGAAGAGIAVLHDRGSPAAPAPSASQPADDGRVAGSGIVEASTGTIAIGTPLPVWWNSWTSAGTTTSPRASRSSVSTPVISPTDVALCLRRLIRRRLPCRRCNASFDAVAAPQMAGFVTRTDLVQRQSDLAVANANVEAARAQLHELDAETARRTVRAPVSGRILKINVRPGEVAESTATAGPVLLMGGDDPLYVRVDVDEHDAWRVRGGVPGEAFVQGRHQLHARCGSCASSLSSSRRPA